MAINKAVINVKQNMLRNESAEAYPRDLAQDKTRKIVRCKEQATAHIFGILPEHKQRNIALWGSGYGYTKDQAGAFILAVKQRCDGYEALIDAAADSAALDAIQIDYSDILP